MFNLRRLEKGSHALASDMTGEQTPDDDGLGCAVRLDRKNRFMGRGRQGESPALGQKILALGISMDVGH